MIPTHIVVFMLMLSLLIVVSLITYYILSNIIDTHNKKNLTKKISQRAKNSIENILEESNNQLTTLMKYNKK